VASENCCAPPRAECPRCGTFCKRHSKRTRRIKDIDLEQPTTIIIKVGVYRCQGCQKFFRFQPSFCEKGKHYSKRAREKARQAVVEDRTTFTGLGRRLKRDFHIQPSVSTGYRWFHEAADKIDFERDYESWAAEGFSGYLAVDELYDGFAILVATDPLRDRTISVRLCKSANEQELRAFLTHLKEDLGIDPKVFISDGSSLYNKIPRQIWPKVKSQLCIFHYTRLITRRVSEGVTAVAKRLRGNPDTRQCGQKLWRARYCFVMRPENLNPKQRRLVQELCFCCPTIRLLRDFMVEVFALFSKDQTRKEAIEKHMVLLVTQAPRYKQNPSIRQAYRHLRPAQLLRAVTFLDFPGCPRTTNHVERANRFYRKRAKSHYRNRTKRAIWNMIKSDLMVRRNWA